MEKKKELVSLGLVFYGIRSFSRCVKDKGRQKLCSIKGTYIDFFNFNDGKDTGGKNKSRVSFTVSSKNKS